jgi:hypothetical protein
MSDSPEATATPNGGSGALAVADMPPGLERLQRRPIVDLINPRQYELLKQKTPLLTDGERAQALELCAMYALDPYANEVWFTKGQGRDGNAGRLLIMVGRDGLRKIAHRQGLLMDGDVVRAQDEFMVERRPDGSRVVHHKYAGSAEVRGEVVGAWAEVRTKEGLVKGFFFAPLTEYKPTNENKIKYSPWGSQLSVMILAAAERQALRQATPLSGLIAEGELDLNEERAAAIEVQESVSDFVYALDGPSDETKAALAEAIDRLNDVEPNAYSLGKAQMVLPGKTDEELAAAIETIERDTEEALARLEDERSREVKIADAEVVGDEPAAEPAEQAALEVE